MLTSFQVSVNLLLASDEVNASHHVLLQKVLEHYRKMAPGKDTARMKSGREKKPSAKVRDNGDQTLSLEGYSCEKSKFMHGNAI